MAFENLDFKGRWRDYQSRVLLELDGMIDNQHLHIVAAPGAGKTVLGIEVMRRLGHPAVVVAPTITIRDQWISRLTSMFLQQEDFPAWVSTDIRKPKFLTVTTYQSLHSAFARMTDDSVNGDLLENDEGVADEEESATKISRDCLNHILGLLRKRGTRTIVLDEAHHLRNEWWKALTELKAGLENPVILSLTATPPYDVEFLEWQRYEELCGPMDVEISVPELVRSNDLCPHQDFIHLSVPSEIELQKLGEFKDGVLAFFERLRGNAQLRDGLLRHDWILRPQEHAGQILEDPSFYSSIVILLNSLGVEISPKALGVLGVDKVKIPEMNPQWLETFLNGLIFAKRASFFHLESEIKNIEKELRKTGAIEKRRVILTNNKTMQGLLSSSLGKLQSIVEIARFESDKLGDQLRMVILTDFIRKEAMGREESSFDGKAHLVKAGVIPIFEKLRSSGIEKDRLCVLTGSLVILPRELTEEFTEICLSEGIENNKISHKPLVYDHNFSSVDISGKDSSKIVHCITRMFNEGKIRIVVGTQALLGEGWDAPTLNTLVLASNVGSYMLSNQIRGRAIRKDPQRPEKIANIWHLVTLDLESVWEHIKRVFFGQSDRNETFSLFDPIPHDLGSDLRTIMRRFRSFAAPSFTIPLQIENGFSRMGLDSELLTLGRRSKRYSGGAEVRVQEINQRTFLRAGNRRDTAERWGRALLGSDARMHPQVSSTGGPRVFIFANTLKVLFFSAVAATLHAFFSVGGGGGGRQSGFLFFIGLIVAGVFGGPRIYKFIRLWISNGSIEGSVHQVAQTVLNTLGEQKIISTPVKNIRVMTKSIPGGYAVCRIEGAKTPEEQIFTETLQEALGAVHNHRYIILRSESKWLFKTVDYHPVPAIFASKKSGAEAYAKHWKNLVGEDRLVFTRNEEGRAILLKARTQSLASNFVRKSDIRSIWE